jgi:hypothetical protein
VREMRRGFVDLAVRRSGASGSDSAAVSVDVEVVVDPEGGRVGDLLGRLATRDVRYDTDTDTDALRIRIRMRQHRNGIFKEVFHVRWTQRTVTTAGPAVIWVARGSGRLNAGAVRRHGRRAAPAGAGGRR